MRRIWIEFSMHTSLNGSCVGSRWPGLFRSNFLGAASLAFGGWKICVEDPRGLTSVLLALSSKPLLRRFVGQVFCWGLESGCCWVRSSTSFTSLRFGGCRSSVTSFVCSAYVLRLTGSFDGRGPLPASTVGIELASLNCGGAEARSGLE